MTSHILGNVDMNDADDTQRQLTARSPASWAVRFAWLPILFFGAAIRMLNEAACRYFQLSRREAAIGKTCYDLAQGRCGPCAHCAVTSTLPEGNQITFERKGPFDPERIEQITVYRVDEVPSGVSGVIRQIGDITESENMEKHLTRADRLSSLGQHSLRSSCKVLVSSERQPFAAARVFTRQGNTIHNEQALPSAVRCVSVKAAQSSNRNVWS